MLRLKKEARTYVKKCFGPRCLRDGVAPGGNSGRTELFFETTARSSDDWTRWGRVIKRGGGVRAEERLNDRAIEKEEGGRERPDTLALSSIISYCLLRHLI